MHIATKDLEIARSMVRNSGGWLLDLGDGHFLATNDEDAVRALRGQAFVAHSQQTRQWDETQIKVERGRDWSGSGGSKLRIDGKAVCFI